MTAREGERAIGEWLSGEGVDGEGECAARRGGGESRADEEEHSEPTIDVGGGESDEGCEWEKSVGGECWVPDVLVLPTAVAHSAATS